MPSLVSFSNDIVNRNETKNDKPFTDLLKRFRAATHTEDDIKCIQSRFGNPTDINNPTHALHIFAENVPVDRHNNEHLDHLTKHLYTLKATDHCPPNVTKQDLNRVLARGRSETGGLHPVILAKENARVMLTTNININDKLQTLYGLKL